jgi:hypothetical protein
MDLERTTGLIFALERLINRPFKKVIPVIPFSPVLPYRGYSVQAKPTLTNGNSRVSKN